MLGNQKTNIFSLLKWVTEQYIRLERKTLPYPFKLGAFDNNSNFSIKNGKLLAKVEFAGQASSIDIELAQIIQENLFEYFSPTCKKKIFYSYYNKEKFKLTDRYFCPDNQIEMVVLTDILSGNKITLPAHTVSDNDDLIEQLGRGDIKKISFISAMEHFKSIFKGKK